MRSNSLPLLPLLLAALALHLATATATAASPPSLFVPRAISCASGSKVCGQTCIPNSYTCCPSGDGGCPVDTVCQLGDNGLYGCCPTGQICDGDGGAQWVSGNATSTATASVSVVVGTGTATGTAALPDKTNGAAAAAARRGLSRSGLLALVVAMGMV